MQDGHTHARTHAPTLPYQGTAMLPCSIHEEPQVVLPNWEVKRVTEHTSTPEIADSNNIFRCTHMAHLYRSSMIRVHINFMPYTVTVVEIMFDPSVNLRTIEFPRKTV